MDEKYNPTRVEASPESIDQFLENQIHYYRARVGARKNTPMEKHPETECLIKFMGELEHMRWKASKIFTSAVEATCEP